MLRHSRERMKIFSKRMKSLEVKEISGNNSTCMEVILLKVLILTLLKHQQAQSMEASALVSTFTLS